MKTLSAVIVAVAILVVPGAAAAKSKDPDKKAAIAACKTERGKTKASHRAFKAKYHSFRGCTHAKVAKVHAARRVAAGECKDERSDEGFPAAHDDKSFEDFYGSNHNHRNAFGKCVSTKVDEQEGQDEADDPAEETEDHGGKCDDEHGSSHDQADDESDDDSGSDG